MAGRAPIVAIGPGRMVASSCPGTVPAPLAIPQAEADPSAAPQLPRDGMTCLASYSLVFWDPQWGPTSLAVSVWRDQAERLPDYVVVVD